MKSGMLLAVPVFLLVSGCELFNKEKKDTKQKTENTPPVINTTEISGKAIDGYIVGAEVFLDLNGDLKLNDGEPTTVSTENGDFQFELTDEELECFAYSPVVVNVPVGAMDEDLGKVTEAYQMILPPSFSEIDTEKSYFVTPLTSLLASAVYLTKESANGDLSCEKLKSDQFKQDQMLRDIDQAITATVKHYNISAEQILSDYIDSNDELTKEIAIDIVRGLKQSLLAKSQLRELHPSAASIQIQYYKFDNRDYNNLDENAWYRESLIWSNEYQDYTHEVVRISEDFTQDLERIIYDENQFIKFDDHYFVERVRISPSYNLNNTYECSISEEIYNNWPYTHSLTIQNSIYKDVSSFDECLPYDFKTQASSRMVFIDFEEDNVHYTSQFTFYIDEHGQFPELNHWINLEPNLEDLDISEYENYLLSLPYTFEDTNSGGATYWYKSKTYQEDDNTVELRTNNLGGYVKTTTARNGTSEEVCSSDSGATWQECD